MTITKKRIMAVLIVLALTFSIGTAALAVPGGRVTATEAALRESGSSSSVIKGYLQNGDQFAILSTYTGSYLHVQVYYGYYFNYAVSQGWGSDAFQGYVSNSLVTTWN